MQDQKNRDKNNKNQTKILSRRNIDRLKQKFALQVYDKEVLGFLKDRTQRTSTKSTVLDDELVSQCSTFDQVAFSQDKDKLENYRDGTYIT